MDATQVRDETGESREPPEIRCSCGHGPGGSVRRSHPGRTRVQRQGLLHPGHAAAHSIAAQGGINAAKNYQNDGDSIYRLFYDTVKGGDYRSREASVYRLAELSVDIIDQCVAQGVPFAREYGGLLDNRSFGGAPVSRTFYARGQTGQQLLLGAYSAHERGQNGSVTMYPRREMLELVVVDGRARGIVVRNLLTGAFESHVADAVLLATGGYGNVYYLSTNAKASNATAIWRAHRKGAFFANPCFTQIHPTCIPVHGDYQSKLTLMSESLRNDGRIWVPKDPDDPRHPNDIPEEDRSYYLEETYPAFGNLVPRDVASRKAKDQCDKGRGVGSTRMAVYLDFRDAIERLGRETIEARYGNLFQMYQRIVDEDPYTQPMMIYPAVHYTMGGLWVDYNLMSNLPGLFVVSEANFSDHGANRLGASTLMQGLADGYFIIPYTMADYLARVQPDRLDGNHPIPRRGGPWRNAPPVIDQGKRTVDEIHRELGACSPGTRSACRAIAGAGRGPVGDPGHSRGVLEKRRRYGKTRTSTRAWKKRGASPISSTGGLMAFDALHREESCGGHFREEYQTPEGEAQRDDERFAYAAAWEHQGDGQAAVCTEEKADLRGRDTYTAKYK